MLRLKHITKDYGQGDSRVQALRGLDICFRANEFVAILGPSGCGKTTLLNLIGGLDQYTDGDLIIAGRSTKEFKDRDWDAYRNHSIGFVFQSYNLIPHQTVLSNVELALTLSGVSRAQRRRRAKEALEKVGLGDQLHKKPNQMSGGQMQRVAIARALVNDPEILLADEPTGALDSETSVQVMDLLKEIAQDRMVIMVTHNPDLADQYATRTVKLLDGRIVSDSDPYSAEEEAAEHTEQTAVKVKKPSMSMATALGLSLNNLMTKKARTLLTAFAGAIGIIGIALILSLSTGIQNYIDQVQEDTLSSYPIQIQAETMDMTAMMTTMMGQQETKLENRQEEGYVYANTVMYDMMNSLNNAQMQTNDLKAFRQWLLQPENPLLPHTSAIQYSYDLNMEIYTQDPNGEIIKSDVMEMMAASMEGVYGESAVGTTSSMMSNMAAFGTMSLWQEMLPGENGETVSSLLEEQYDLVHGAWPQAFDEVVLVISEQNELADLMMYALGLKDQETMLEVVQASMKQEQIDTSDDHGWSFEELCRKEFKLLLPSECYDYDAAAGTYRDLRQTDAGMEFLYKSKDTGIALKVVGIIRPNPDATATMLSGAMAYTSLLTDYVLSTLEDQQIIAQQMADPAMDVISGLPFATEDDVEPSAEEKREAILAYIADLDTAQKAAMYLDVASRPSDVFLAQTVAQQMEGMTRGDIETMVVEKYAAEMGVDTETIQDYIAQMDDETLFAAVEEALTMAVAEQYTATVKEQLSAMSNEQLAANLDLGNISDEDLQAIMALASLPVEQLMTMLQAGQITQEQFGLSRLPAQQLAQLQLSAAQYIYLYDTYMPATVSSSTYEDNLKLLGYVDKTSPASVSVYAATFADKDAIADCITDYNTSVGEDQEISYTDYVAILMSSITTIINAISYVLIAFVAISLVVSSIMIGIITYISVLERTKEIGILRAIGASKHDVSRVFNAETIIEGFVSGAMGIGVTLLLIIPINAIVQKLTEIASLSAVLPWRAAVVLVLISMGLTVIAGLVPSGIAARKDPVEALRTE
jgi:putative ABC transport system permease protein